MSEETRIDVALRAAVSRIAGCSDSPRLDAELLLMQALNVQRSYLIAHPEDTLDRAAELRFDSLVDRRSRGEPIAYISGQKEFWTLNLMVSPATLVPRPETELLVQLALNNIERDRAVDVLDLGTGSGAVALAIASERPLARVTATDISEAALNIARENARQADLANVTFAAGSWTEPVRDGKFAIIVSNPPYVRADDPALALLEHEPLSALASGADGLDAIRILARDCADLLVPNGILLLEHGSDQASEVAGILQPQGWHNPQCHSDLAGLPRVTVATRTDCKA